jgi:hypothetical protein
VKEEKEKAVTASTRSGSAENKEIMSLREQLAVSKNQVQELTAKVEKVCKSEAHANIFPCGICFLTLLISFNIHISNAYTIFLCITL